MSLRLVGALALLIVGGGVTLAVQQDETACERYRSVVERQGEATFEAAQREQVVTLAACMAEEARTSR